MPDPLDFRVVTEDGGIVASAADSAHAVALAAPLLARFPVVVQDAQGTVIAWGGNVEQPPPPVSEPLTLAVNPSSDDPRRFTFTVGGADAGTSTEIDFGDGESASLLSGTVSVEHLYGTPGEYHVLVQNGGRTAETFVQVQPGEAEFALVSLEPPSVRLTDPDTAVTVNGSGIVEGAVVVVDNVDKRTVYVSPEQVRWTVRPSTVTEETTVQVKVRNPGGATSNELPFSYVNGSGRLGS